MYEYLRKQAEFQGIKRFAVGAGVFDAHGRLLVLKRRADDSFPDMYEIPGGGVEPGASILDALRRELKEETRLKLRSVLNYCGTFDYFEQAATRQFDFLVDTEPGEVRLTEHQSHCWITSEWEVSFTGEMRGSVRRLFLRQESYGSMTSDARTKLDAIKAYAKDKLSGDRSGHDFSHADRVAGMAGQICRAEGGDAFLVLAAAYLHDVIDDKVVTDPEQALSELQQFLSDTGLSKQDDAIGQIICNISFKQSLAGGSPLEKLEAKIVQDADRLDAIGAIGIGRTFYYGGKHGTAMHDPMIPVREHMMPEVYRQPGTVINHFYEKLLLLMDQMHTKTARDIAKHRQAYMLKFLDEFYGEWTGLLE